MTTRISSPTHYNISMQQRMFIEPEGQDAQAARAKW
jgi:hypothetical protein